MTEISSVIIVSARWIHNQALFEKIYAHEDSGVVAEYAEPFATLLDPNIFVLKGEFERQNTRNTQGGRPNEAAHLSLTALLKKCKTKNQHLFFWCWFK